MKKLRIALIGLGQRGWGLWNGVLKNMEDVECVAACDSYSDRVQTFANELEETGKGRPLTFTDYKQCIDEACPDAVIVAASWAAHIEVSLYAMEKGIPVGCEVGGAYSLESLWALVRCYERTKTPIMMLENCCFGRLELLALNMKRLGLLGQVVHCDGRYGHDLRQEITGGWKNRHYRLDEYIHRNCENYPTHEIGPIAKILDINCGNRFVSLHSFGSKSVGLQEYVKEKQIEELKDVTFNQSDVVTTVIQCMNGETVTITLDTTLARYYSRGFCVHGTKGIVTEDNSTVYLEEDQEGEIWDWSPYYNNIQTYYDKYDHKLWQGYTPQGGHGGMDWLCLKRFFECVRTGEPMPIDVYDMVTWMSITVLSEQSLMTGQTVNFPDFTEGKWVLRKNNFEI